MAAALKLCAPAEGTKMAFAFHHWDLAKVPNSMTLHIFTLEFLLASLPCLFKYFFRRFGFGLGGWSHSQRTCTFVPVLMSSVFLICPSCLLPNLALECRVPSSDAPVAALVLTLSIYVFSGKGRGEREMREGSYHIIRNQLSCFL